MKCHKLQNALALSSSLPVRGAWVEIAIGKDKYNQQQGRSPCGERGLK